MTELDMSGLFRVFHPLGSLVSDRLVPSRLSDPKIKSLQSRVPFFLGFVLWGLSLPTSKLIARIPPPRWGPNQTIKRWFEEAGGRGETPPPRRALVSVFFKEKFNFYALI